jgi:hypothetical protein
MKELHVQTFMMDMDETKRICLLHRGGGGGERTYEYFVYN